jgi:hypothetical protein
LTPDRGIRGATTNNTAVCQGDVCCCEHVRLRRIGWEEGRLGMVYLRNRLHHTHSYAASPHAQQATRCALAPTHVLAGVAAEKRHCSAVYCKYVTFNTSLRNSRCPFIAFLTHTHSCMHTDCNGAPPPAYTVLYPRCCSCFFSHARVQSAEKARLDRFAAD